PMQYARRHLVLPLGRGPGTLEVAMADPAALAPLDDLRMLYGLRIEPVVVPANALREAIARAYDAAAAAAAEDGSTLGARLELDATPLDDTEPPDLLEAGEDAPAIRLVNAVLYEAVRANASDVHVEPFERSVAVRLRIDGVLHDLLAPPLSLHAALVSRVKIMAGLDIAERRLPQGGRNALRGGGRGGGVPGAVVPAPPRARLGLRLPHPAGRARGARGARPPAPRPRRGHDHQRSRVRARAEPRPAAGHRANRQRQDHHPLCTAPPPGHGRAQRDDHRGSDRVSAAGHRPAPGGAAHRPHLRGGSALDPAAGSRRHPGRGDPRSRDHGDRAAGRAHGPPGARDAPH